MPATEPAIEDALKQRNGVQKRRLLRDCRNIGGNGPDYISGVTHNEIGWKAKVDMEAIHGEIDPLSETYPVVVTHSCRVNTTEYTVNWLLQHQN